MLNLSMIVSSFKYLKIFDIIVSLSPWIYSELSSINYVDSKLLIAMRKNDSDIISSILYLSKNQDIINSVLYYFSYDETYNYNQIKSLLESGAKILNDKLLISACWRKDIKIIKLLIQHGIKPCNLSLIYCCRYGLVEIFTLLLDTGIDLTDDKNKDLLKIASIHGHTEIVKLLLEAGIDPHYDDDFALKAAVDRNHIGVIIALLKHKDDIDTTCSCGIL